MRPDTPPTWIDLKPANTRRRLSSTALAGGVILSAFIVFVAVFVTIMSRRHISSRDATFNRFETSPIGDVASSRLDPSQAPHGLGRLKIINTAPFDILVALVEKNAARNSQRRILVRMFHDNTVTNIAPGLYSVSYCSGVPWVPISDSFSNTGYCQELLEPLTFTQTHDGSRLFYNVRIITVRYPALDDVERRVSDAIE